jgi:hypothetical protein
MNNTTRGFTLLLAVLVSSILLALGFAIYNIAVKQVILSSAGRESQFAFYAADSGIECALYADYQQDAFATTSSLGAISCGEGTLPPDGVGGGVVVLSRDDSLFPNTRTTTFTFSLGPSLTNACTTVVVEKTYSPSDETLATVVDSSGHNTCVTVDQRRIERTIRMRY